MDKKVTMQDVADAAGVSKSTVSFILNGRDDLRISEQTKKKVWQVINMLNYRPNLYAKNLRGTQSNHVIAFYQSPNLSDLEKRHFYEFFDTAANLLLASGKRAQLLLNIERLDNADAIVAKSLCADNFRLLAQCNFIPLIAGDCVVNDPIFYEVNLDYSALKALADRELGQNYTYVCTCPKDDRLKTQLLETFSNVFFVREMSDLDSFDASAAFVTEPVLETLLLAAGKAVYYPQGLLERHVRQLLDCATYAIDREQQKEHRFAVV